MLFIYFFMLTSGLIEGQGLCHCNLSRQFIVVIIAFLHFPSKTSGKSL